MSPRQQLWPQCGHFSRLWPHCGHNLWKQPKEEQISIQSTCIEPLAIFCTQILSECGNNVFSILFSFGSIKFFFGNSFTQFPITQSQSNINRLICLITGFLDNGTSIRIQAIVFLRQLIFHILYSVCHIHIFFSISLRAIYVNIWRFVTSLICRPLQFDYDRSRFFIISFVLFCSNDITNCKIVI